MIEIIIVPLSLYHMVLWFNRIQEQKSRVATPVQLVSINATQLGLKFIVYFMKNKVIDD